MDQIRQQGSQAITEQCGVKPLNNTEVPAHPHKFYPKPPELLSDILLLSRDPESILEGIGPEDHSLSQLAAEQQQERRPKLIST